MKERIDFLIYFPSKERIDLGDLWHFIATRPFYTLASFVGSDDYVMKLATIYFVEYVLMGKRKTRNVSERVMKIIDDDQLCSSFRWGLFIFKS